VGRTRAGIRFAGSHVHTHMTGVLILLAVLAIPYVGMNLRRLYRGRTWAFTFCQVAREWEEREHAKRLASRASQHVGSDGPLP